MALVRGGPVLPHVQRFADAVAAATGAESFGTYPGHDPSLERAMDIFVPVSSDVLGNKITAYAIANLDRFGIWYLIYRQRIYNPSIAGYWRAMERRGDPNVFDNTANHFDHVHISFEATAPDLPDPYEPPPPDIPEGAAHMLTFRYIFDGLDWVFDGPSSLFFQLNDTKQITEVLDKLNVPSLGQVSPATHQRFKELAQSAGFAS